MDQITPPNELEVTLPLRALWPARDDEILRDGWAKGKSGSQIAAELNRTKNSVIARANRLGLGRHLSKETPFPPEEDETLRSQYADGKPIKHIAKDMGRSIFSVSKRINRLALVRKAAPRPSAESVKEIIAA